MLFLGGFASVYLVVEKKSKIRYALKRMYLNSDDAEQLKIAKWEFDISQSLPQHINIVQCCGARQQKQQNNNDIEYLLLLEYCSSGTHP